MFGETKRTCSFCHHPNTVGNGRLYCTSCGHRGDVPRSCCDCAMCRGDREQAEHMAAGLARLSERVAAGGDVRADL
jgi:hypothetical protein